LSAVKFLNSSNVWSRLWNTKCSLILPRWLFWVCYFYKMSFPISQDHFAKMLGFQAHVGKSSTSHCKCYFCQLHIPLPIAHCQIVNSTLWVLHCQLAKLTSFFGLPQCS
jgi:hypothetical protein